MKKIGILTWHYYANFGSALQAYALQRAVEKLGHDAVIVNYRNPRFFAHPWKEKMCGVIGRVVRHIPVKVARRLSYPFQVFQANYMRQTAVATDRQQLFRLTKGLDCIICGSDQIWAPNVFDPVYMLEFISGNQIRKVSYAASIGLNTIPERLQPCYQKLIGDFHAISLREESGKQLLQDACGLDSAVVLDPTFLLEADHYCKLLHRVLGVSEPYLFCYFLNKDHQYRERVEQYAKAHNLHIVGFSAQPRDRVWMDNLEHIGPQEFLWLIAHSQAVFTDSYHGTIFSLLLHKEFYTLERFSSQDPICQNSRIYQLDRWFGIGGRILGPEDFPENCPKLDYEIIDKNLRRARELSYGYLKEALE